MDFKLQEMKEEELDKLVELIDREKKRRKKSTIEAYFKEMADLIERMKKDNITIEYETEYGFGRVETCWLSEYCVRIG